MCMHLPLQCHRISLLRTATARMRRPETIRRGASITVIRFVTFEMK